MTNVIDTHAPIESAYQNLQPKYWETLDPTVLMPRRTTAIDPRLCVPCAGPAFRTPWGDPVWLKPPGGLILNGKVPGATPTGHTGNYITPNPMLPSTPTGPVLAGGTTLPPSVTPTGGAVPNVLEQAQDIWTDVQPEAEQAWAEAQRLGKKQIPVWWAVAAFVALSMLRR